MNIHEDLKKRNLKVENFNKYNFLENNGDIVINYISGKYESKNYDYTIPNFNEVIYTNTYGSCFARLYQLQDILNEFQEKYNDEYVKEKYWRIRNYMDYWMRLSNN